MYKLEDYAVDGIIPQDKLSKLEERKAILNAELCEIEAILCEHRANAMKAYAEKTRTRYGR